MRPKLVVLYTTPLGKVGDGRICGLAGEAFVCKLFGTIRILCVFSVSLHELKIYLDNLGQIVHD